MKKIKYFTAAVLLMINFSFAQIQTADLPKAGFEKRIEDYVNSLWLIDTHEHLYTEEERLQQAHEIDFTYLFSSGYTGDIISAGLPGNLMDLVFSYQIPIKERWKLFKPVLDVIRNDAYQRAAFLAAKDIYGIDDINDDTYELLSEKMREASKPGLYKKILKDRAKIELSILDLKHKHYDPEFYRHVERFDRFIYVFSITDMKVLGQKYNIDVRTLDDYVKALRSAFKAGLDYKMVGVKTALAYDRTLKYDNTPKDKAAAVFNKLAAGEKATDGEIKALQDYMMHRVLDLADEFNMPVQVHTGLNGANYIDFAKPTHLTNLFFEYPGVNFIIFHSSYPYGGELSVLSKSFPNVFIDMCWTPIISPDYSIRYLDEWLETVPANKIMVFGGDYKGVELAYAHSVFARRIVSEVLINKVRKGYFSEKEAKYIANRILRENALEIFKLKGHSRSTKNIDVLKQPGIIHDYWTVFKKKEGWIRDWKIIGPFPLGKGLAESYPPEKEIDFNKTYAGLNGEARWKTIKIDKNGYLNFITQYSGCSLDMAAIAYAYTEIVSPEEREITLTIGSNDGAKMWLNGKVIYNADIARGAAPDDDFLRLHLKKGLNKLLVKVENFGKSWGLYVRIVDPDRVLKIKK